MKYKKYLDQIGALIVSIAFIITALLSEYATNSVHYHKGYLPNNLLVAALMAYVFFQAGREHAANRKPRDDQDGGG